MLDVIAWPVQAHRGVLQTTEDDRRQRAKKYWPPTLCVGGPVIMHTNQKLS